MTDTDIKARSDYRLAMARARKIVRDEQIAMAVGWQFNNYDDDTIGWCQLHAVGPAFVHTVLVTVRP